MQVGWEVRHPDIYIQMEARIGSLLISNDHIHYFSLFIIFSASNQYAAFGLRYVFMSEIKYRVASVLTFNVLTTFNVFRQWLTRPQ